MARALGLGVNSGRWCAQDVKSCMCIQHQWWNWIQEPQGYYCKQWQVESSVRRISTSSTANTSGKSGKWQQLQGKTFCGPVLYVRTAWCPQEWDAQMWLNRKLHDLPWIINLTKLSSNNCFFKLHEILIICLEGNKIFISREMLKWYPQSSHRTTTLKPLSLFLLLHDLVNNPSPSIL